MSKRQTIEDELKAIWDSRGQLVAAEVVDVAADPSHPLHEFFEWDDNEAAQRYRVSQAANLIRSVKINVVQEDQSGEIKDYKIRAWIPARTAGAEAASGAYLPEASIRESPALRTVTLQQMRRELNAFRRRYQHLAEFWSAVTELVQEEQAS